MPNIPGRLRRRYAPRMLQVLDTPAQPKPIKGRGFFRERPLLEDCIDLEPTPRHVRWMQLLNLHGCLSSSLLYEADAETHRSYRAAELQLQRLWRAGYVYRPIQQRGTDNANYHDYVYDLTDKGWAFLKRHGLKVDAMRPASTRSRDKWPHNFMIACITASMHILCLRNGYRYIPPHEYLARVGRLRFAKKIPFMHDGIRREKWLTPDSVFAIDYGGGVSIVYALEADRDSEGGSTTDWARKSVRSSVLQYAYVIGRKKYKELWPLPAGKEHPMMMLLYVTVNPTAENLALRTIDEEIGDCTFIAVGQVPEFDPPFFKPPKLLTHLFEGPLKRAGVKPWTIKKTAEAV